MVLEIAVCDDSIEYGEIVKNIIEVTMKENNIYCNIHTYCSGKMLVEACEEFEFNIIFLDMEMPEMNGIETGISIRAISEKPVIFYLTSHKEYAYESYKVKAKNYLLKPVNALVIEKVLLDCIQEIKKPLSYLDVKNFEGILHHIPINEITKILRKKEDRKLHIYSLDKKEIVIVQTLESIEKELIDNYYIKRSSKSCIVNMDNVRAIKKNIIYFSNDTSEEASRRCLSELTNNFKKISMVVKT